MPTRTILSSYSDFTGEDDAQLDEVESELSRRLEFLNGDDDIVVLLGLAAAGLADRTRAAGAAAGAGGSRVDPEEFGVPAAEFARFQRLWYHFKIPYGRASLVWWYLFCLGLAREAGGTAAALDRMAHWLGELEGDLGGVLPRAAAVLDQRTEVVVVTEAPLADVAALATAVRHQAPLLAVTDAEAAAAIGRAAGREVLTSAHSGPGAHPDPSADCDPADGGGTGLWRGRPARLRGLAAEARLGWRELPDQERDELLASFERRLPSIERVRALVDETPLDNRAAAAVIADCRKHPVPDWSEPQLVLATVLRCWHEAGFVLQELNQSLLSFPALALFLTRRAREYAARLPGPAPEPPLDGGVLALARALGQARGSVERAYERCLHFDGSNWERREFLLPKAVYSRLQSLPESLCAQLYEVTGVEVPGRSGAAGEWDAFLEGVLAVGGTPTRVIQEFARWAADTDDLPVDLAVFTVPVGRKLDTPWTMEFTDLFCYTAFREGFRPEDAGVAGDRVSMYNIIAQRMRYNAVKKAQNYAPVMRFAPQGFNLPDIAIAEDANHGGHTAAGIRLACRLPLSISYREREWSGLADVRLNRCEYLRDNRFRPHDMVLGRRYTQWARAIAESTYRRGLQFEEKWSGKVKDLDI